VEPREAAARSGKYKHINGGVDPSLPLIGELSSFETDSVPFAALRLLGGFGKQSVSADRLASDRACQQKHLFEGCPAKHGSVE